MESCPMKEVLARVIPQIAESDSKVVYLDADLMSCVGMDKWAGEHPDRAFNCGIAEANMIGIAAGLSAMGYKPIVHSFGVFASRRCFDQTFLSCGYAGNPIVIIGSDPGICAEYNGGTHMPLEDAALLREIPNSTVVEITDAAMLTSVLTQMKDRSGVNYIRVGRKMYAKVYSDDHKFEIGKAEVIKDGRDVAIVGTGIMVHEAMEAAKQLAEQNIDAAVIDLFTIKPVDNELLAKFARKTGCVVTAENHNKIGGVYSAVCESLAGICPVPIKGVAVENSFGEVGDRAYLRGRFGLTSDRIVQYAKDVIAIKVNGTCASAG